MGDYAEEAFSNYERRGYYCGSVGPKASTCAVCGEVFSGKWALKAHIKERGYGFDQYLCALRASR